MRYWLFILVLLLLSSPLAYGQPQYTEAACILLQQQIERFSQQPQGRIYQDSKRQFDNHCQKPITAPTAELRLTNIPAEPLTPSSNIQVVPSQQPQQVAPAPTATQQTTSTPIKPAGAMREILSTTFKLMSTSALLLLGLLLAVGFIGLLLNLHGARIKGALAERQLRRVLQRELPAGYLHYHNLVLPTAQGDLTEIDHLVLSPFGIFVFEVKNYRGWIFGSEHQPQWIVQHFRSKHSFQNPLRQNYKHTQAVNHLLDLPISAGQSQVHSIVAFSLRAVFKTQMPANVIFIELVADYLQQFKQVCFSDEQLRQFNAQLNMAAASKKVLSKQHRKQVTEKQ